MNKIDISAWLDNLGIKDYAIKADLTVDVYESVNLANHGIKEIPFQFNIVDGDFLLQENELTSLKGFPAKVKGNCDCSKNKITDLSFCPKEIDGYFCCSSNDIKSLDIAPERVGGDFHCDLNDIEDFDNFKTHFEGEFFYISCWANKPHIQRFSQYYDSFEQILMTSEEFNSLRVQIRYERLDITLRNKPHDIKTTKI